MVSNLFKEELVRAYINSVKGRTFSIALCDKLDTNAKSVKNNQILASLPVRIVQSNHYRDIIYFQWVKQREFAGLSLTYETVALLDDDHRVLVCQHMQGPCVLTDATTLSIRSVKENVPPDLESESLAWGVTL